MWVVGKPRCHGQPPNKFCAVVARMFSHILQPTSHKQLLGDCSAGVPPVPIPNTEVKPCSPDGTARASVWESRTSPELNTKPRSVRTDPGAFAFGSIFGIRH